MFDDFSARSDILDECGDVYGRLNPLGLAFASATFFARRFGDFLRRVFDVSGDGLIHNPRIVFTEECKVHPVSENSRFAGMTEEEIAIEIERIDAWGELFGDDEWLSPSELRVRVLFSEDYDVDKLLNLVRKGSGKGGPTKVPVTDGDAHCADWSDGAEGSEAPADKTEPETAESVEPGENVEGATPEDDAQDFADDEVDA